MGMSATLVPTPPKGSQADLTPAEQSAIVAAEEQKQPDVMGLAAYVEDVFQTNKRYRENAGNGLTVSIDEQMIQNLRQREALYSNDKLQQIRQSGLSEVFTSQTDVKCRGAENWIHDIADDPVGSCATLEPTPLPDLPGDFENAIVNKTMMEVFATFQQTGQMPRPEEAFTMASQLRTSVEDTLMDEAKIRSNRMQTKIRDQLTEGGWADAWDDFISDIVTNKCAIIKGPIVRRHKQLAWKSGAFGKKVPKVTTILHYEYERVDPMDFYPSEGMVEPDDGDTCERVRFTRKALQEMKGVPGWDEDAINLVLKKYGQSGYRIPAVQIDQEREDIEAKSSSINNRRNMIEGVEFWGSIQGKMLIERQVEKDPKGNKLEPLKEYDVVVIKLAEIVVYSAFNEEPMGRKIYSKTGYAKIPGSFWYKGIPELMRDIQDICNASVRSLCNNMAVSSGPILTIEDINRIAPGQDITNIIPWMIMQFVRKPGDNTSAVNFHNVESHAQELMGVFDSFSKLADDWTGVPAYQYGNPQVAGAGRTSSGLNALMTASARGIKRVIARIDLHVIRPVIERQYNMNMMFDPDDTIKGDVQIVPAGIMGLIMREQMTKSRLAFLQESSQNPTDQALFDPRHRANVWRLIADDLEMPVDRVVPTDNEIAKKEVMAAQMQAMQAQAGAGVKAA